jgi:hypothetical protein
VNSCGEHGANMDNPYAAHDLTPELVAEERQRPKFWRGLLTAYAVHHVCAVLGMLTGVLIMPSEWPRHFPPDKPHIVLANLVLIPALDLFLVLEPPLLSFVAPELVTFWHWLRIPLVLTIPVALFLYAKSRRRDWLWVLAIVSFGVFVSLVLWFDPRTMGR